jgi:hypothetical protein
MGPSPANPVNALFPAAVPKERFKLKQAICKQSTSHTVVDMRVYDAPAERMFSQAPNCPSSLRYALAT